MHGATSPAWKHTLAKSETIGDEIWCNLIVVHLVKCTNENGVHKVILLDKMRLSLNNQINKTKSIKYLFLINN